MNFTEKYRPKVLSDLILEDKIFNYLNNLNENNIGNLLFYSSQGTGKTSCSLIIVKKLDSEHIEINASKSTGIDIVREVIEPYAITYSFNGKKKAIILSEAEQLCLPGDTEILVGTGKYCLEIKKIRELKTYCWTRMYSVNLKTLKLEKDWGRLVEREEVDFYKIKLDNKSFLALIYF
jgi:hypothetical protein